MVQERRRREEVVSLAFDKYAALFVERYAKAKELRSWKEVQHIVNHDLIPAFKGRPLPEITRAEIARLLEGLTARAPAVVRYAHAILRKLFRWAVDRGDITVSPMVDMPAPAVLAARDLVLSDKELKAVSLACADIGYPFGSLVQLLIATGQRIGEVSALDWSENDRAKKLCKLPAEHANNGDWPM